MKKLNIDLLLLVLLLVSLRLLEITIRLYRACHWKTASVKCGDDTMVNVRFSVT